jgi:hypothetical protein
MPFARSHVDGAGKCREQWQWRWDSMILFVRPDLGLGVFECGGSPPGARLRSAHVPQACRCCFRGISPWVARACCRYFQHGNGAIQRGSEKEEAEGWWKGGHSCH